MARRATALANVVVEEAGNDPQKQIEVAFRRTLSRQPDARERELAGRILKPTSATDSASDSQDNAGTSRLMQFCHALLNLNEFVYIP